LEIEKALK
jgi:hypothetical protein